MGDHVLVGQEQSRLLELLTQLQLKIDGVKVSDLISEMDRMCPLCLLSKVVYVKLNKGTRNANF